MGSAFLVGPRVCEAYQWPANAIFLHLELKGSIVHQMYGPTLWGPIRGVLFQQHCQCHSVRTAPTAFQSFSIPQCTSVNCPVHICMHWNFWSRAIVARIYVHYCLYYCTYLHVRIFVLVFVHIFVVRICTFIIMIRRTFSTALLPRLFGTKVPGHTTRAPPVGFELATNGIQLYAIANLDKTSLYI